MHPGLLGLVACNPNEGAAPPDTGDGAAEHADAVDRELESELGPSECAAGRASANFGERCVVGRTHCHCTSPCTGVELLPEESYPRWACREVDPKCPEAVPEDGTRCKPEGQRCGWGTCGGSSAVGENRKWSVDHHHGPRP
ncbi:hypothetical protein [Enhygromyxa salina]|uniref:hypothetical protein n=1 Tax=Enhygromyxa salina TaxID=215803 RepID=UPI000D0950A9|nr:hypothetical protein [Enhygromyxa salina]